MADPAPFRFEDFHRELLRARPAGELAAGFPLDNLLVVERVDSTQRLTRDIVTDYLEESLVPPRLVLVAAHQTAGRGRQGRSWVSPAGGGVWATLVWRPEGDPDGDPQGDLLALLPLRVAVALARAVEELVGRPCRVKWPNDLMVGEGKIGGVLIEALARGQGRLALVGFGVNHHFGAGGPPVPTATAVTTEAGAESDRVPSLGETFWCLAHGLAEELTAPRGAAEVVAAFRRRSRHQLGEAMVCRVGGRQISGRFRGFDDRGFLQLEVDGEVETLAAGEVIER